MSKLDAEKLLANSYLEEIDATIEIRRSYNNIVVARAGILMSTLSDDKTARQNMQQALKYKTVDPNILYKSLLVQINGVFENYIRNLVQIILEERFETVENYCNLEKNFRTNYITYAARVLTYFKTGAVMGVSYNFDNLLTNLGKSLSGQKGYKLNPEVYTKLMGNCTADRVENLFDALTLPEPFSDALGKNAQIKEHFKDSAKGRLAMRAKEKIDVQIALRNNIVHGDLTLVVDLTKVRDTLSYFRALISGLDEIVRT